MADTVKVRALTLLWSTVEERYVEPGEVIVLPSEIADILVANAACEIVASPSKVPLGPVQPTEKE